MKSISLEFDSHFPRPSDTLYGVSREAIKDCFIAAGEIRHVERLDMCNDYFKVLFCHKCGSMYPVSLGCKSQMCEVCGKKRWWGLAQRFQEQLEDRTKDYDQTRYRLRRLEMGLPRIKPRDYGKERYKEIRQYFLKFLKHENIKGKIEGSVYVIETKFSQRGDTYKDHVIEETGWNIHIHALIWSEYIDNRYANHVSSAWQDATGGIAEYAYIDEARSSGQGLYETVKYYCKPPTLRTPENYLEYYQATKRIRLLSTNGIFYRMKLGESARKGPKMACPYDNTELELEDASIDRDEAFEIVRDHAPPANTLDSHLKINRFPKPVVKK